MNRLAINGGTPIRTRPFPRWPVFDEQEEKAVLALLRSGTWWRYSFGEATEADLNASSESQVARFQRQFADMQGGRYGIACANGTGAIEVVLRALGVGPGDEVIVPGYTFIATASAVLMINAVPIFADIDHDTFNISPRSIAQLITPRTKAIIPVHFAGQSADMDAILTTARDHNLSVVEDSAHAHGGAWKHGGLGTIGNAGTFSFQASKNMTAGEGGLILTNDRELARLCESYVWGGREIGRPWYEHHRLGWNYRMTEFQGAILQQQLKRLEAQNNKRRQNAAYLARHLAQIPGIRPLAVPEYVSKHSYHLFIFRFDEQQFGLSRDDFIAALEFEGIPCSPGYAHGLYKNPMFINHQFYPRGCPLNCGHYDRTIDYRSFSETCPNVERACQEAVWLEHRQLLADEKDMQDIVTAVEKIFECRQEFSKQSVIARS